MSEDLEAEVTELLQSDLDEPAGSSDRVERAVAVAHSQLAVKDTLALVFGMWKALAALMLPIFGYSDGDNETGRDREQKKRSDD